MYGYLKMSFIQHFCLILPIFFQIWASIAPISNIFTLIQRYFTDLVQYLVQLWYMVRVGMLRKMTRILIILRELQHVIVFGNNIELHMSNVICRQFARIQSFGVI